MQEHELCILILINILIPKRETKTVASDAS